MEGFQVNVNTLVIPRVFKNIRENRIRGVINALRIGEIDKIDMISRKGENGEEFNRVFIHMKRWYDNNPTATRAKERLGEGKEIKIVYDEPWFWKVTAYRKPNTSYNTPLVPRGLKAARPPQKKAHLVFDTEDTKKQVQQQRPPPPSSPPPSPQTPDFAKANLEKQFDAVASTPEPEPPSTPEDDSESYKGGRLDYGNPANGIPKKRKNVSRK